MPSTIYWPASLPCAQRAGHGNSPRSAALASDFGLVNRSREIYSDMPADVTVSWSFSAAELWYFAGFYKHVLKSGTQYFWLTITAGGTTEEREVTFGGKTWQEVLEGLSDGRLTAALISRKGTQMDADTWAALQDFDSPAEYLAFLEAFNQFAEVDMPAPTFKEE